MFSDPLNNLLKQFHNMEKIVLYLAGKVSPDSSFQTSFWRDDVCKRLWEQLWCNVVNLDPTQWCLDEHDSLWVVWRDMYMIQNADIVVWFLTDDISVGWSQELLIAKYLWKPVIGFCEHWGKFYQDKELYGTVYKDRKHPFVVFSCDVLVHTYEALPEAIKQIVIQSWSVKTIQVIDDTLQLYIDKYLENDIYIKEQLK